MAAPGPVIPSSDDRARSWLILAGGLVDRFLPFDQRVLIRVYVTPTDGRSGGGHVSYDTARALVRVCC